MKRGITRPENRKQAATAIVAHLHGSENVSCPAFGLTINNTSPVLALCRALVARGVDPSLPLHIYRGTTLALVVRSIGKGAGLRIGSHGVGFERDHECGRASPVAESDTARLTAAPPRRAVACARVQGGRR